MEGQKRFHITITDNWTGETYHDKDTQSIIGAYADDDGVFRISMLSECNTDTAANTVAAVEQSVAELYGEYPVLLLAVGAIKYGNEENEEDK